MERSTRLWLALCLLAFCMAGPLCAQLVAPQLRTVTVREGLSSDQVRAIAKDARGHLWIGTADGLDRYEGRRVTVFRSRNSERALPADFITTLAADDHRFLYVGTSAAFLTVIDVIEDTLVNVPLPVPAFSQHGEQRVNEVHIDREQRIWVAHGARCFSAYDPRTRQFTTTEVAPQVPTPPSREVVMHIDEDADGMLWLSLFRGLARFDPTDRSLTHIRLHPVPGSPGEGYAFQIRGLIDNDSCLVFGTWSEGIFRMRKRDGAVRLLWPEAAHKPTFVDHMVQDILRLDDAHALVATIDQGILRLDLRSGAVLHYDRSLNERDCRKSQDLFTTASVIRGYGDLIAMGSLTQGFALWTPGLDAVTGHQLPPHDPAEIIDEVMDLDRDERTGDLLVLSHRRGCFVHDSAGGSRGPLRALSKASDRRYLAMERTGEGVYLLAGMPTWTEVNTISGEARLPRYAISGTPCGEGIWWARGDGKHGLWCMTGTKGLYHVDTIALSCTPVAEMYPDLAAALSNWPWDVFVDPKGRSWFLSATAPPVVLHTDGHVERVHGPPSLAPFEVSDIAATPDGQVWLAVKHAGLARVSDGAPNGPLQVKDMSDHLLSKNITDLQALSDGTLWMTRPNALQHFDPISDRCTELTAADGVPSGPLNLGRSRTPWPAPLVVGTWEGYFVVNDRAREASDPPAVQLPVLWAADSVIATNADLAHNTLVLPYTSNRIAFQLRSTELMDPQRVEFRYRLIGLDTTWTTVQEDRATFNNLRQGTYRFEVKARTAAGAWGPTTVIPFTIEPPFWARWWFRTLLLIMLAALAWAIFHDVLRRKLRVQRELLERERAVLEERIRIAHDLHDDLGSGLASIGMESELAIMEAADPVTREALLRVSENARNVGDDMRRIVWAMGSGQETLGDLLAYVRALAGDYLEQADVELVFEQDVESTGVILSMKLRKHLVLFTKEALHNVVRHAQAKRVTFRVKEKAGALDWVIADDGRGFDPQLRDGAGTGTTSMRERARALHADLHVQSAAGQGTHIRLVVGIDTVY